MTKENKKVAEQPAIRELTKEEMLMVSGGRGSSSTGGTGGGCGVC
ncbi:hypothetical protein [Phaeobacter sp.]|nr:hypothetical protein [Phaeobacter sp.]